MQVQSQTCAGIEKMDGGDFRRGMIYWQGCCDLIFAERASTRASGGVLFADDFSA